MDKSETQRSPRIQISIAAVLIDSDGGELPVQVVDLSSSGFRLQSDEQLIAGENVRLRIPRCGDYRAQLKWVNGHDTGGSFLEAVHL